MKVLVLFLFSIAASAGTAENKKLVHDFYDLAFNQHKPVEAANQYLAEEYIQHNPFAGTGRAAFINYFKDAFKDEKSKQSRNSFKRLIAEDDLVVVHSHRQANEKDRGFAVVDIFRVKNGKIVEHWDVNQPVPEKSANNNTMF